MISDKTLCSKNFTGTLYEGNCNDYNSYKFSNKFNFIPSFPFRNNQQQESIFSLWSGKEKFRISNFDACYSYLFFTVISGYDIWPTVLNIKKIANLVLARLT